MTDEQTTDEQSNNSLSKSDEKVLPETNSQKKTKNNGNESSNEEPALGSNLKAMGPLTPSHEKGPVKPKILIWGPPDTYKTRTSLHFPGVAYANLEKGDSYYAQEFDYHFCDIKNWEQFDNLLRFLEITPNHGKKTLVIDSFSKLIKFQANYWNRLLKENNKGGKGHKGDYYETQIKDYNLINPHFDSLMNRLISIDMTVICISRAKEKRDSDNPMKKDGLEKEAKAMIEHEFDQVINTYLDSNGVPHYFVERDRSKTLPRNRGLHPFNYEALESCFGRAVLNRKAKVSVLANKTQLSLIQKYCKELKISKDKFLENLPVFGATSLDDLLKIQADKVIESLESQIEKQNKEKGE